MTDFTSIGYVNRSDLPSVWRSLYFDVSSLAFAIGTLRLIAAASAPSARIQSARGSAPASSSRSRSGTPVHSLQDTSPWVCPHVWTGGVAPYIAPLLPAHSRKWIRDS